MKAKRLLFLVMAICLASTVKAQFYDSADDIFYYLEDHYEEDDFYWTYYPGGIPKSPQYTGKKNIKKSDNPYVLIFNFDGLKAAELTGNSEGSSVSDVKSKIANNTSWYEDKVETTDYRIRYNSSSPGVSYKDGSVTYEFSRDRNTLKRIPSGEHPRIRVYKRVEKSYFKVGRSRTPSGTLYD